MAGVNVSIGADSKKAERELKSFERKTRGIAKSIAKGFKERVGHKLFDGLAGAARSIPGMLNEAVQSASSLNEEISKSETIFGSSSKQIQEWAKGAAESMGLSEVAALEFSGVIGNMFTAMGMAQGESARMSQSMVQLGSDLGSFNNTSTEDAINAIGAALRGESEPIRRYGVLLDDATLKAEAMAMGLYDGVGALKPAVKAQAAYNVILKQTTAAQGDFQKTSDGLANSQKQLKAKFADASAEIGKALLPAMQSFVDLLNNFDWGEAEEGIRMLAKAFNYLAEKAGIAYDIQKGFLELTAGIILGDVKKETPDLGGEDFGFNEPILSDKDLAEINEFAKVLEEIKKEDKGIPFVNPKEKEKEEEIKEEKKKPAPIVMKMRKKGPEDLTKDESFMDNLRRTRNQLDNVSSQSSITAVSSMQRVGGGGGVSGQLDLQRKQTDLQTKMVGLLRDIKESTGKSISDF